MQKTYLFVAGLAARFCVEQRWWAREDCANPGLRSETWGTRIWGGGKGCANSMVAVLA
jgi:hypothetical protein